jgi:hypothetical protein
MMHALARLGRRRAGSVARIDARDGHHRPPGVDGVVLEPPADRAADRGASGARQVSRTHPTSCQEIFELFERRIERLAQIAAVAILVIGCFLVTAVPRRDALRRAAVPVHVAPLCVATRQAEWTSHGRCKPDDPAPGARRIGPLPYCSWTRSSRTHRDWSSGAGAFRNGAARAAGLAHRASARRRAQRRLLATHRRQPGRAARPRRAFRRARARIPAGGQQSARRRHPAAHARGVHRFFLYRDGEAIVATSAAPPLGSPAASPSPCCRRSPTRSSV